MGFAMTPRSRNPASVAFAHLCAGAVLLILASAAAAQDTRQPRPANPPPVQSAPAAVKDDGFFNTLGRWLDDSISGIGSTFKGARGSLDNLGREAGIAARSTADAAKDVAKDAADVVTRLPNARLISGHQLCVLAPNGAPDCVAAANAVCRAKGFDSGKSVDMTTAEKCPARVWLSGRAAGECTTETFVSRALCQ